MTRRRALALILASIFAASIALCGLSACSSSSAKGGTEHSTDISAQLTYERSMDLDYAALFTVDYYQDGYKLITVSEDGGYLVVPEGAPVPDDLDADIKILYQPFDKVYIVGTSVMDMFRAIDEIGSIRLSGCKQNDWYIEEAREAMKAGDILYAGKYSMPDYELIVTEGCDLAVESTMIYHSPEVKEALESRGIPVFVDRSSYEIEPLGRTEWVKLYAVLFNQEELADAAFAEQEQILDEVTASVSQQEDVKTIGYFYISSSGSVNVRKTEDYIPRMIQLGGGEYIFQDLGGDSTAAATVKLQMEEFYSGAKEADYLIYNSTIDGELMNLDTLMGKSELLAKFKAVQDGNVWCTRESMYQESMSLGEFIADVHKIIQDPDTPDEELHYLFKLT